jgi:hypothetical protein
MKITAEGVFASTLQILKTLVDNSQYVKLLNTEDKPYKSLVEWIVKRSSISYNVRYPSLKTIGASIGINGQMVTKHIKTIYDDIIELNNSNIDLFIKPGDIVCCFSFKAYRRSGYFYIGLKTIPRIGEKFEFDFMLPMVGADMFYIRDINHTIIKGVHEIDVTATGHEQFLYLKLLREKAYLTKYISWDEFYGFQEDEEKVNQKVLKMNTRL